MSNIVPLNTFTYQQTVEHPIRHIMIRNDPWFVAADVCKILELDDVSKAVSRLDDDEKGTNIIPTPGGPQNMLCVSEPGLYRLIFQSRKPEAKAFMRWVTHDVLPTIRKTGYYSVSKQKQLPAANVLRPCVDEPELTPAQELELVLKYVQHIWDRKQEAPTAAVLRNWVTRLEVDVIRIRLDELVDQGELTSFQTSHAMKYKPTH